MLHPLLKQIFQRSEKKPLRRRWAAGRDGQRLERLEPRSMFAANLAPVNSVPGAQTATVDQPLAFTAYRGTAVETTVFSLASVNAAPTSIDLGNTAWLLWCTGGQIWRSKPDGTDKAVVVAPSTGSFIACFDIDETNSRIYFTEELSTGASNSKIYSTALDGSDRQTIYSSTGLGHINYSLTVDATAGYVFLHSHDPAPVADLGPFYDGKIQRITIATGAVTILPTTFWYAHDLEVSATSTLFLAGFSAYNDSSSRLYSQNVDGSANQELSVTGLATLNLALAERTNSLYVSTDSQSATTGNIYRVPSSGGDPVLVFDGSAAIRDVECDETADLLYWITDTAIYRSTTKGANAQAVVTGLTGTDNKDLSVVTSSARTLPENAPIGTSVGRLSASDVNPGDSFTYALVAGTGSTDNASFGITDGQLFTAAALDFETKASYSVRIRATDQGGLFTEKTFAITVTNVNETPTDVVLSSSVVAENVPLSTTVGTLAAADPDAGNTFTYALVAGTGSTDNAAFTIVGNALKTAAALNFETKASYSVRVRATDQGGLFTEKTFTIAVTNVNEAPTDVVLSSSVIAENSAIGTTVGTFTTADPDVGGSFTYTLVAGTGSTDNAAFTIVGNALRMAVVPDFEVKSSYFVRVRSADQGGLFTEKTFTIAVTNVNEIPINILLSLPTVPEASPIGTTVGTLTAADPDAGNTFTYALVTGTGSTDNAAFTIVGNTLKTATAINFETKSSYSVRIRVTDQGGLTTETPFTITVTNVNETPTDVVLSSSVVAENVPLSTTVGTLAAADPDAGNTFTYALVAGTGSTDNAAFTIVGNALKTATALNFETKASYSVRIRATDQGGLFTEKTFTITVTNVNESPTDTFLSFSSVMETAPVGTTIGTLSTADPDAGDTFTYSLVAGGGSTDNASFTIVGNALKTATPLDFATKPSYSVRVRSTDRGGLFRGQAFTITVVRSNATPTDIALSASAVAENSVIGTTVGTLSTADPDVGNTFTYSLVPGSGSDDNAAFTIVGNTLATATPLNFEDKPTYTVRIRSTDQGNLVTEKAFVVAVTDVVEPRSAPTATLPAAFTVVEDTPSGLVFSGTPFADADSPVSKPMIVTLRVADGVVAAASADGVTVGGTALARTFSGTRAALNAFFTAAPARITYTTAANNTAPRTLTTTIAEFYGTVGYSSQVTSAIAITPVNDAPAVAAPATFTVTEDVRSNLTWPVSLTPFKDIDSPTLTVTLSVGDGTISAAGTAAVAVGGTATARTFTGSPAGLNAYFKTIGAVGYTTAQNNTVARTLTTVVSDGLLSAAASTQLLITPVNDAPTISPSTTFSGGRVGTPYEITYESLRLALNVADLETALPSIVITAIDSGIVQRWSGTAWVAVSMAATAPLAQRSLTPGQKLRWLPPASGHGDQAAFKVKSRDGALYSAVTAQVIVNLTPV